MKYSSWLYNDIIKWNVFRMNGNTTYSMLFVVSLKTCSKNNWVTVNLRRSWWSLQWWRHELSWLSLVVQYSYNVLYILLLWLTLNINKIMYSQMAPQISPSRAIYCEDFGENWQRYNGYAFYMVVPSELALACIQEIFLFTMCWFEGLLSSPRALGNNVNSE